MENVVQLKKISLKQCELKVKVFHKLVFRV